MDANTRKLERIFDQTITYQIPLFQRPYVWTQEANWEPLWEDIQSLLDKHLRGQKVHPHFLGAVVLEQLGNSTGSIESRQVIDGQQRFTTLQLFLIAARDVATANGVGKYIERFTDLVANRRSKIDHDDEVFKVWPTNSNRAAFRVVHEAGSPAGVEKALKAQSQLNVGLNNIIDGYRFFYGQLTAWIDGKLDDGDEADLDKKTSETRFESLWNIVKDQLQVVVIDLDKNDETQVIFETLNARGEDLLPADLIKNFLFRCAAGDGENVEKLYTNHWQQFETKWWREDTKQGRITRPRVDVFINFYLAMMTRAEVRSAHLFSAFKQFVEDSGDITGFALVIPHTAAEHIESLAKYAAIYQKINQAENHPRLATFIRRLEAVDTTTVYPFLLYAYAGLATDDRVKFDRILELVESYLIRRMVCGLTTKNYNHYFVDLIQALETAQSLSATSVADYLRKSSAESAVFPDDTAVHSAIVELPLYGRLAQYKVRAVLEALDAFAHTSKSEAQALPPGLTIEHVMPQTWTTHWPLAEVDRVDEATGNLDPLKEQRSTLRRHRLVNTIGNLTLITGSLNPSLSNSAWDTKRPELLKFSKLNLTQYFHGTEASQWDESAIEKRTSYFSAQLTKIWPGV